MYNFYKLDFPKTLEEALKLMSENDNKRVISGGTDVLVKVREGHGTDIEYVSIHDLSELKGVSMASNGDILIKAATCFTNVKKNEIIEKYIPVLGNAADQVGGPQTRNAGTIGGNVCNGATSADTASTLFALNAKLRLVKASGERIIDIADFYKGPGNVDLAPGEILVDIIITKDNYEGFKGKYIKYAMRNAMDIATLGCVVHAKINSSGVIEDYRLAYGVAGPTPVRCPKSEALAIGKKVSDSLLNEIAETAITEVNARSSWRATKEFRLHLVQELSKRALTNVSEQFGGAK